MLWELWPCLLFALCVLRGRCDLLFKLWSFVDMPTEVIEFSTGIYILVYMYLYIFQVIYNTFSLFARTFACDLISYMKLVCLYLRMWCPQWTDEKLTQVLNIPTEKFMPIMIFLYQHFIPPQCTDSKNPRMYPVLVCLVCVVPCYTSIKGQYEIHTLTSLYGSLVVFGNHDWHAFSL